MAIKVLAVSVDGADITRLAEFWAGALDQTVSPGATDGIAAIAIRCCSTKSRKARSSRTASI